jgi:hypothetical protein
LPSLFSKLYYARSGSSSSSLLDPSTELNLTMRKRYMSSPRVRAEEKKENIESVKIL